MKPERKLFLAFILNLMFSVFEFIGGVMTGSTAIASDAVHDLGDAASIGISYVLEKKSKQQPDATHTYGYARYSVLGGLITTLVLLAGSAVIICHAVGKIITPTEIHYDGMIGFAVVGVCVNFCAAFLTRDGSSVNQKAVNLHMLEDVLGWAVVLAGAVVMRFTDFALLDPIMSIGVSVYILTHAIGNLREIADLFLEKTPRAIDIAELKAHLEHIEGVQEVHHIHLWSMDGQHHCATMHVVTDHTPHEIKAAIREELREHGIAHVTMELESSLECCHEKECRTPVCAHSEHHHHHGHHHGHHHSH